MARLRRPRLPVDRVVEGVEGHRFDRRYHVPKRIAAGLKARAPPLWRPKAVAWNQSTMSAISLGVAKVAGGEECLPPDDAEIALEEAVEDGEQIVETAGLGFAD